MLIAHVNTPQNVYLLQYRRWMVELRIPLAHGDGLPPSLDEAIRNLGTSLHPLVELGDKTTIGFNQPVMELLRAVDHPIGKLLHERNIIGKI